MPTSDSIKFRMARCHFLSMHATAWDIFEKDILRPFIGYDELKALMVINDHVDEYIVPFVLLAHHTGLKLNDLANL